MPDSDSDVVPVPAPNTAEAAAAGPGAEIAAGATAGESDGSPIPSWIKAHHDPLADMAYDISSSSDDGDEFQSQQIKEDNAEGAPTLHPQPSDAPSSPPATQPDPGSSHRPGAENGAAAGGPSGSQAAEEAPSKGAANHRSEVTVLFPERLNRNKVIVELEPAEHGATDLSGDSGAVGRFIVSGKGDSQELRIDLKGIVYKASIVPLAGTMCVINIGQTDAKVEALCTDFIRLKEESNFYSSEAVMEGNLVEEDLSDEEPAALPQAGDKAAGPAAGKAASKKKAKGQGSAGDAFKAIMQKDKAVGAAPKKGAKKKVDGGGNDAFTALLKGGGGVKKKKAGAGKPQAESRGKAAKPAAKKKGAAKKKPAAKK